MGILEMVGARIVQDEDLQQRQPGVKFRHKGWSANPGLGVPGNDEAEVSGKLGLFYQPQRFCRVANALYFRKSPLQDRLAHECLKWIVVHQ